MRAAAEARALRALVSAALAPDAAPAPPPLAAAEWEQVAAAGLRGGVGPLLFAAVAARPDGLACPAAVRARLRAAHVHSAARALRRQREVARVLTALRAGGVATLVLKGAALAEAAYPDPALRPMHDVDLLVRSEARARARSVLLGLGYEDESNGPEDFVNAAAGLDIDLHTELVNATRLPLRRRAWDADLEGVWRRAVPARVAGVPAAVPDPVDHFVYLSQHLMLHHGMDGPLRFADLLAVGVRLADAGGWPAVAAAARQGRAGLAVWLALSYLRHGFGLPVPQGAMTALAPAWPGPARRAVVATILAHRFTEDAKFLFALLALRGAGARAAYVRQLLFPEAGAGPGNGPAGPRRWRRRLEHAGRISRILWGAARRALRI